MKHCFIILILELCSTALVLSQGTLREFVVDKDDNPQVFYRGKGCLPDVGVLVFYTTIPNLKFSMPDTPSRLKNVSDFDRENNCYVLCVQPNDTRIGGIVQYSIAITAIDFKPMPAFMVSGVNAGVVQYFNIILKEDWQSAFESLRKEIAMLRSENSEVAATNKQDSGNKNREQITGEQITEETSDLTGSEVKRVNGDVYNADGIELIYVEGRGGIRDYYIGKLEVTQAQWTAIVGKNPSGHKDDLLPVTNISWNDVQIFISNLNRKTGMNYRLPTENEWEFAARGGSNSRNYTYSGSNNPKEVAWTSDDRNGWRPSIVGTKAPNELGIYDMSGNVWEWCADQLGKRRVFRGGATNQSENNCLPTTRNKSEKAKYHHSLVGFRIALSPPQNETDNVTGDARGSRNVIPDNVDSASKMPANAVQEKIAGSSERNTEIYNPDGIELIHVEGKAGLQDFYIGKFEVTQAQWTAITGKNPSGNKGDLLPVTNVSWKDVDDFIFILNKKTGRQYRLSTESEWEYAARGGIYSRNYMYSGGDNPIEVAWTANDRNGWRQSVVGTKAPNELGIYDMSGNVWEWCADILGKNRVFRGGATNQSGHNCLPTSRLIGKNIKYSHSLVGFRLALTTPQNSSKTPVDAVQEKTTCSNGESYNPDGIDLIYVEGTGGVQDFYIGKYEVTQAQWMAIMGSNPSGHKMDILPVTGISWNHIQDFILILNKRTGRQYRLPTEAEWEYAARGGSKSRNCIYSGGNNLIEVAWTADDNNGWRPSIVGTKAPNELGIHDMSGNVWEWCADQLGNNRVFRGGATNQKGENCLPTSRNINEKAKYRHNLVGFRLVLTPQHNATNSVTESKDMIP